jgi:hypothetical protein
MKADDLASGWDLLNELVSEYKAVINGKQASVYNSPDIIEVNLNDDKR